MMLRNRFFPLLVTLCLCSAIPGCKPPAQEPKESQPTPSPTPAATPKPTPTPSPTPIYVPRKQMEVANLYSGIRLKTTFETEPGTLSAAWQREEKESYTVEVNVRVKVPQPNTDLASLSRLNAKLPELLPGLAAMLPTAEVSPTFEDLYRRKITFLERNLPRLEQLLSTHNFYDCETILHLRHPESQRAVLLLQSEMDIDTDGSDGDRIPNPEGKDRFFQPMTSYGWPKQTNVPNPFLAGSQERLKTAQAELAAAKPGAKNLQALRDRVGAARYQVNQLTSKSFLISETDPFIVLPSFMFSGKDPHFTPKLGDYCVVIYKDLIYPAIVGDAGPSFKAGEASFRMARQLNSRSSLLSRPVSDLKVTYVVFPNSADAEPGPPDLNRWRSEVEKLLGEIGGYGGTLFAWETIAQPAPTPTPEPTPTPTPSPLPESATPQPSPTVTPELPTPTPTPGEEAAAPAPSAAG